MSEKRIIDVWMQHPTKRFVNHEMFASLRKWLNLDKVEEEISLEMTIGAMDS